MKLNKNPEVVVVGGGLAGLSAALHLAKNGVSVLVIEKKCYPFHRVCGEYISNEVLTYLQFLEVDINSLQPARISRFQLSSPAGNVLEAPLDLGGFGISRFALDFYLYEMALAAGVQFLLETTVESVIFSDNIFKVAVSGGLVLESGVVVGAFGKRANLDRQLKRPFFTASSPYIGVKYHLKTYLPRNLISLHNFENGYAGISAIEQNRFCFCYLTTRKNLKQYGNIEKMESGLLAQNPHLKRILNESEFLFAKPEVINEISFAQKNCIEDHILCCGDAAGMIAPLCGNGMAMAFHSAKILSEAILTYFQTGQNRAQLEKQYAQAWQEAFGNRLKIGRAVQGLFGRKMLSEATITLLKKMPAAVQFIMKQTHGKPF